LEDALAKEEARKLKEATERAEQASEQPPEDAEAEAQEEELLGEELKLTVASDEGQKEEMSVKGSAKLGSAPGS